MAYRISKKWVGFLALFVAVILMGQELIPTVKNRVFAPQQSDWSVIGGFTINGEYNSDKKELTPVLKHSKEIKLWASWSGSDKNTGTLVSKVFNAPGKIGLFIVGYPNFIGNQLYLEQVSTKKRLTVTSENPTEYWKESWITMPDNWVNTKVRVVAVDNTTRMRGWLGVSTPFEVHWWQLGFNFQQRVYFVFILIYFVFSAWLVNLIRFL
jgi:hypothetical protein